MLEMSESRKKFTYIEMLQACCEYQINNKIQLKLLFSPVSEENILHTNKGSLTLKYLALTQYLNT